MAMPRNVTFAASIARTGHFIEKVISSAVMHQPLQQNEELL
jgi:hypothetical protein